jgi:hypothetical protein
MNARHIEHSGCPFGPCFGIDEMRPSAKLTGLAISEPGYITAPVKARQVPFTQYRVYRLELHIPQPPVLSPPPDVHAGALRSHFHVFPQADVSRSLSDAAACMPEYVAVGDTKRTAG